MTKPEMREVYLQSTSHNCYLSQVKLQMTGAALGSLASVVVVNFYEFLDETSSDSVKPVLWNQDIFTMIFLGVAINIFMIITSLTSFIHIASKYSY